MTYQHFTLSILAICILTVNVFAQKNTTIQPQVQETETTVEKTTPKVVAQPKFGSIARPNIYTNLDENIQKWEQKAATIEADPNHDENVLIKHKATLERLRKIKAERPKGQ